MKKFLDCISVVGSTPSRFQGTKKYVSTGAVATTEIDESEVVEVSYEDRPSRANLTAEAGDILFAKMQGTRKTLLLDSETEENIYSTGFYAVRANPQIITTECLYYLIDSELFLTQKDKNCSGATQKAITNGGLAKIEIRIPPLSEQGVLTEKLRYLTQLIADKRKQPVILTGCTVILAVGVIKDFLVQTASGMPMECPPPSTRETVGFFIPAIISAMARPASISPPTVFSRSSSPSISSLSSMPARRGRTCSYLVVFTVSGATW